MPEKKKFELSPSMSIIIAGVIIAAAIVFVRENPQQPTVQAAAAQQQQQQAPVAVNVPAVTPNDHIVGSVNAPIKLVEYSDFQCPFCQMVYPTIKRIVSESGGKVAWVYREFPLSSIHPNALPAALAAECINEQLGNDGFWKFADAIFTDQTKMSDAYYAQLAAQFGADPKKFADCYSSQKYLSKINAETADAENNGGQGTPYTVIIDQHGKQTAISGAIPYEQFNATVKAIENQ